MRKGILLFAALLIINFTAFSIDEGMMVIKINFSDKNIAVTKLKPLKLTYEDVTSKYAQALVTRDQYDAIQALGFTCDVLYENSMIRAIERKASMAERWTSYANLTTQMQTMATTYSNICRLHDVGLTVQNRHIYVMEITDNPDIDETDEPEIRMAGNIHGDEYEALELMKQLMEYLTSNYGSNPTITNLINTREIWVQPSINPDGHENGTRSNAHGVDMNRNHGYMYDFTSGSGPFSEPELQHFREYSLLRNFSLSLSFHGETTYFNYLWNFTGQNAYDKAYMEYIGAAYTVDNNYEVVEGWDWYQTNGDTNDWSYGCRGDMDITIETPGNSSDWDENRDEMIYIIQQAAYGIQGVVTDANSGQPLEALVTIIEHPMTVYTDPVAGDFHRPLLAGTYDMKVWANGYAAQLITDITVANQSTSTRNVQLSPNFEYYAMHACWNNIDDYYSSNSTSWFEGYPHRALGPADGVPYSLGRNCEAAFDMGAGFEINNNPGNDLRVIEADVGDGDEGYTVYGSSGNFLGPWVQIGIGSGTTEFDLDPTTLEAVRYIRIKDDNNGSYTGTYPGFDLDAMQAIAVVEGCGVVNFNSSVYTCDNQAVAVTLIDTDLNVDPESVESYEITVTSDSQPAGETVTLTEISADSDTFTGSVLLSEEQSGGGYLLVDRGDSIIATYDDSDCEGEPRTVFDTASANCADPVLTFNNYTILDSPGDDDGAWDPGESVQLQVMLQNTGNEIASQVTAQIASNHPEYVTIDDDAAEFPNIHAGGSGTSMDPHFQITASASTPNHTMIHFTITMTSADSVNVSNFDIEVTTSTFMIRYSWNMDANPGWTTEGQWAWGAPTGDGDPDAGYTGTNVYGYNLAGDYGDDIPEYSLTSGAIYCGNLGEVELRFQRWLGVESSSYDHAYLKLSTNGTTWTTIWTHSGSSFEDTSWQSMTYDISAYADQQTTVYLRWVMGTTDGSVTYCGWNIDDVEIWAESTGPAPTPTVAPPTGTPTNTRTPTQTRTPTVSPTPVPPTHTPQPTETPTITFTPTPTNTNTPTSTMTPTQTPVWTETPVPTSTYTFTPSATPTSTPPPHSPTPTNPPPTSTNTPIPPTPTTPPGSPTYTPIPEPTNTPAPGELIYDLIMNQITYHPFDHFMFSRSIVNTTQTFEADEYILLDVGGVYWFWPSWSQTPDSQQISINPGDEIDDVILDLWWPNVDGSASGLRFWGALIDQSNGGLIGNYDMAEWGYAP